VPAAPPVEPNSSSILIKRFSKNIASDLHSLTVVSS
jgi:hypothetical protein